MNQEQEKLVNRITELLRQVAAPWCVQCRATMRGNGRGWYCGNRLHHPDNPEAPWCLPCRTEMVPYGHSRGGSQRWLCDSCTRTLSSVYLGSLDHGSPKRAIRKTDKYIAAVEMFRQGHSTRMVARTLKLHQMTAIRYRDLGVQEDVRCQCGEPAKHQGWCWYRYQQSPRRQEFMKRWHQPSAR